MPTESARETEDSPYLDSDNLLLDAFKQLTDATCQGANATYAYFNKQFHDLCDYAKYLDENKHVYWLYGGPDGFVLAYSLLKYIPDLIYNGSKTETAKALRDFICNPWGSAITLTLLAASTITSAYANYVGKDKKNDDSQNFYVGWQAFRDGAKGARNVNRGLRSTIDAIKLLSSIDMRYALLPLSLILGIPSMYNRWWNRYMVTVRKKTMDTNDSLTKELLNWGGFNELTYLPPTEEELKKDYANSYLLRNKNNSTERTLFYINRDGVAEDLELTPREINILLQEKATLPNPIDRKHPNLMQWRGLLPNHADKHFRAFNKQITEEIHENIDVEQKNTNHAHKNRFLCNLSAAYDGFTSGLYLFISLILAVPLAPEILTIVTALSALSVVACIFTRLQEEREYHRLLRISEEKAKLISGIKTLQAELAEVAILRKKYGIPQNNEFENPTPVQERELAHFRAADDKSVTTYAYILSVHEELHKISEISPHEAALIGLKHGLIAHGTIVCGIFAASLISKVFFATVLSQAFVFTCVLISAALTLAAIGISMAYAARHRDQQKANGKKQLEAVSKLIDTIKGCHDASVLTNIENETAFADLCDGTPLLNWTFLSWLEILRSMGSGIMKGPKSVDFILLTFFDASSQHDHKHDNPFITGLLVVALISCAIIWTLRAMAKYATKLREKLQKCNDTLPTQQAENVDHDQIDLELGLEANAQNFDQNPDAYLDSPTHHDREDDVFTPTEDSLSEIRRGVSLGEGLNQEAPPTSPLRRFSIHPERRPASTNTVPHSATITETYNS
ncbi:MAG: hypothetical protein P1U36_03975 [Legionellaceae bacterium]|nr:hypothetical protein [Legionellaceae bacterium]